MTNVLAIDQGPAGTKAIVIDAADKVLGLAEHAVHPRHLPGGRIEQDPRELLVSVVRAGRNAIANGGVAIDVVAIANHGQCVLAWDPDTGRPLSNVIVEWDRSADALGSASSEHLPGVAEPTELIRRPGSSAAKRAWLRQVVTRDGVVTTSDSWLVHQLTGEFVTDASSASPSLTTDLDTPSWDVDLLELFGLADEQLPVIVPCDAIVGSTIAFGGTSVVGGLAARRPAALLGEGCLQPGEATCTFSGAAALLANTGIPQAAPKPG